MRYLYWLYALLAFGLCVFLFVHVRRAEGADPRALLEHARACMRGPELDLVQAGHDLEAALAAAEREADRPLIEEVLLERAQFARQTNALARAKADLEHVLAHHRPKSPAIESMLAGVLLDSGEIELALSRADGVLERDRSQPEAWGVRAEALLALADRHIAECVRAAGVRVASSGLGATEALMRRIAARPLSDPTRLRLTRELYESFPTPDKELAREIQARLDDASGLLSAAPEALAQSFRSGMRPKALTAYIRTLHDAGESESAADLGLVALSLPQYLNYGPLLRLMLEVLQTSGRNGAVPELIDAKSARRTGLDGEFFTNWARALVKLEDWPTLMTASQLLRQSDVPENRALGNWCIAMSLARRQRWAEATPMLRRLVQTGTPDPIENATAMVWHALAESARSTGAAPEEITALERALNAATPDFAPIGALHLRLAELELAKPQPNRARALDSLSRAMSRMPERSAELEPRWRELGALLAKGRNVDFARECGELERQNRLAPEGSRPSYEFVALAEHQYAEGRLASALALGMRALEQHPGLLPALRVSSEAAVGLESWGQAVRLLRERIEIEGPSPELVTALANAPPDALGPQRARELVRLDPAGLGRRWSADELRRRGDLPQAIASLERIAQGARTDSDRLLLAELHFERHDHERAQGELAGLTADARVLASAAPLMLSIAARTGAVKHAERVLKLLDAKVELDSERFLEAVDELLAHGFSDVAALACEKLDQRLKWRSPLAHLRLAQCALLAGDAAGANDALDRALAYDESGSAELGLLIAAVEQRRWGDCPGLYADLLATAYQPTGLQFVALAALGEKLVDARIVLRSEIEQRRVEEGAPPGSPATPLEDMLTAALDALERPSAPLTDSEHGFGALPASAVQRDPRPLLARLAALDDPHWAAWAVADLARQSPPARGALWPTYLAARGAAWLGAHDLAERLARSVTTTWPSFAPAWDVALSSLIARTGAEDDPRVLALLDARRAALRTGQLAPVDSSLLEARLARLRGDWDGAARHVESAFQSDARRADVLLERSRIARERKQLGLAVDSLRQRLELPGQPPAPELLREFCSLLESARAQLGPPFEAVRKQQFEFLLEKFGQDPWVRLEHTRWSWPLASGTDPWVAEHAISELERLREQLPEGLEFAQPGVTLRWAEYYARLDPARALALIDSELEWSPHAAELWRARGRYAAELRRDEIALDALRIALEIAPEPSAARALVELSSRRGASTQELERLIERVSGLVGLSRNDPAFRLALARSLATQQRAKLPSALTVLAELWSSASALQPREESWRTIGQLYGVALCRRANAADSAKAVEVFNTLVPTVQEPLGASVLTTLRSLAIAVRARG